MRVTPTGQAGCNSTRPSVQESAEFVPELIHRIRSDVRARFQLGGRTRWARLCPLLGDNG